MDELHSEDKLEIDEDIAFPLPVREQSDQSSLKVNYSAVKNTNLEEQ